MKKRKAKIKPDKFELWLESWRVIIDSEICLVPKADRTISDPGYAGLITEYKTVHFALIKYRKFKRGKK